MRPSYLLLVAMFFLLATAGSARAQGAADLPRKRILFAPGTGTTCASFCSQRWYEHPPSARACITECNTRTLTATMYFRGANRGDRLDCNERLVNPAGRQASCAPRSGLDPRDDLAMPLD